MRTYKVSFRQRFELATRLVCWLLFAFICSAMANANAADDAGSGRAQALRFFDQGVAPEGLRPTATFYRSQIRNESFQYCICRTQSDQEKDNVAKPEMLTCNVRVLDPDGNPVEEATVYCTGMRTKIERASFWRWMPEEHGPVTKHQTDETGMAEIPYPKYVIEKMDTGEISLSVSHPDFVDLRVECDVSESLTMIQLERGFRIALTAIDANTKTKITSDLLGVISGEGAYRVWDLKSNGMLVSPVFKKNDIRMRIVYMPEGQPALFSKLIEIKPGDDSRVMLKEIPLERGTRVEGKLDDSVPRPILNGKVSARIENQADPDDWRSSWEWVDKTTIAADGTFVFESLPRGEVLQLIPVCNGWVPGKPTKDTVLKFFPKHLRFLDHEWSVPQLVELSDETVSTTLVMKQATSVKVTVKTPDGKPLAGAKVDMWPNQLWFDGGSQILGMGFTYQELQWLRQDPAALGNSNIWALFGATTDDNGIAIIKNLPVDTAESIAVTHEDFEMPVSQLERSVKVELKSGVMAEVEVQMQTKGIDALGAIAEALDLTGEDK